VSIRKKTITKQDILSLYEVIVPLVTRNPKSFNLPDLVDEFVHRFVPHNFFGYYMESHSIGERQIDFDFNTIGGLKRSTKSSMMTVIPRPTGQSQHSFAKMVEEHFEEVIAGANKRYGEEQRYDRYRMTSNIRPRLVVEFYRVVRAGKGRFSRSDKLLLRQTEPHVVSLLRLIQMTSNLPVKARYFDAMAELASHVADTYRLSPAEIKLIPDLLFGRNNHEIAGKHFISVATVRTHIRHILQKTQTKNRMDFIGRFFASPEHVQF
jgi:DNA-binding CsgD family transcriptional regulator